MLIPRRAISTYFCFVFLLASCGAPRPSFEQVELAQAQALVESERWLNVVDVQADEHRRSPLSPSSIAWTLSRDEAPILPALTDAPVLVVASGPRLGYRAAALIASERNHEVYLVIIENARERGRLYARDPQPSAGPIESAESADSVESAGEETPSGRDS